MRGPRPAIGRRRVMGLVGAVLILALVIVLGFRTAMPGAREQDGPDFMNGPSGQARQPDPAEAAAAADCQTQREAYEKTLPIPQPTPGVPPNIGYVV